MRRREPGAIAVAFCVGVSVSAAVAQAQDRPRPVSGRAARDLASLLGDQSRAPLRVADAGATAGACSVTPLPDGSQIASQSIDTNKPVYDPIAAGSAPAVLWPGALVQMRAFVKTGVLSGIPVARTGGTVFLTSLAATADPATGRGVTVRAEIPRLGAAAVETERINLVSNPAIRDTAQFSAGISTFSSLTELAFKLNSTIEGLGARFEAQIASNEYHERNNVAVAFFQPIYSYSTEDLAGASTFEDGVTTTSLSPYTSADNPIGYVSSVTYGRMAVLTFSSALDTHDLETFASASVSFLAGSGDVAAERTFRQALSETRLHLWLHGFSMDADAILNSRDKAAALQVAMAGSGPEVIQSALPLWYRVNYLGNNQAAAIDLVARYPSSTRSAAPVVSSASVHVRMGSQPGDNKDWNTALTIHLVDRIDNPSLPLRIRATGHVPRGRGGQGSWQSNTDWDVPLTILEPIPWTSLNRLSLWVSQDPDGRDDMAFVPTVSAQGPAGLSYRTTLGQFTLPTARVFTFQFTSMFEHLTQAPPPVPTVTCAASERAVRPARPALRSR